VKNPEIQKSNNRPQARFVYHRNLAVMQTFSVLSVSEREQMLLSIIRSGRSIFENIDPSLLLLCSEALRHAANGGVMSPAKRVQVQSASACSKSSQISSLDWPSVEVRGSPPGVLMEQQTFDTTFTAFHVKFSMPALAKVRRVLPQAPVSPFWPKMIERCSSLLDISMHDDFIIPPGSDRAPAEFSGVEHFYSKLYLTGPNSARNEAGGYFFFKFHYCPPRNFTTDRPATILELRLPFPPSKRRKRPLLKVVSVPSSTFNDCDPVKNFKGFARESNERYAVHDFLTGARVSKLFTLGVFAPASAAPFAAEAVAAREAKVNPNPIRTAVPSGNGSFFLRRNAASISEPLQAATIALFNLLLPDHAAEAVNDLCRMHKERIDDHFSKRGADIGEVMRRVFTHAKVDPDLVRRNPYIAVAEEWRNGFPYYLGQQQQSKVAPTRGARAFVASLGKDLDAEAAAGTFSPAAVEKSKHLLSILELWSSPPPGKFAERA
jgi:hypothetical protein